MNKLKITILTLTLIGVTNFAMAQAQFAVGIKGGLNFAKLDVGGSASDAYKSRTGYHAGAFALIKIANIGIQPELIFSRQGTKYEVNTKDLNANFDYINIPVIAKIYLPLGLNIQVGPQFGFLTKAEAQDAVSGSYEDVKESFKNSDITAALGAGWDLPFGLTIDARYNLGLSKINDGSNDDSTKNKVFQVSLGYKLIKFGK